MTTEATRTPSDSRIIEPSSASLTLAAVSILVAFVWVFWIFVYRQYRFAIEQQADWGHTLVIPFIAGWFVWLNREKILADPFRPSLLGPVAVLAGIAWYSVTSLGPIWLRHHNIMGVGVAMVLGGLVLSFCGWRSLRYLWFPLAYLVVFGQTISDRFLEIVTFQLQGVATMGADVGLGVLGFDVSRAGHTLWLHEGVESYPVNVAEACSGMRMLVAFLALGVAMAYKGLDTVWQRCLLVLAALPTAVFVNILRVMTLGILATMDSEFAAGEFHSMVGLLWLVPAFFIYLGIMWVLRRLVIEEDDDDAGGAPSAPLSVRFDGRVRAMFVVSVLALVLGGAAFTVGARTLRVYLQTEPIHLRHSLALFPTTIGSWRSVNDIQFDATMIEQLGTSRYIERTYIREDPPADADLSFHVAYYTGEIDAIPHVPDRCLVAGGLTQTMPDPINLVLEVGEGTWEADSASLDGEPFPVVTRPNPLTGEDELVRLPVSDRLLRYMEFRDPNRPGKRVHAGYFFIANGRWRATPGGVKMAAFTGGDKYAYYCKVQIVAAGGRGFGQEEFVELVTDFLEHAMPGVMQSLPDWADVSSGNIE